jgi:hypothetical protein
MLCRVSKQDKYLLGALDKGYFLKIKTTFVECLSVDTRQSCLCRVLAPGHLAKQFLKSLPSARSRHSANPAYISWNNTCFLLLLSFSHSSHPRRRLPCPRHCLHAPSGATLRPPSATLRRPWRGAPSFDPRPAPPPTPLSADPALRAASPCSTTSPSPATRRSRTYSTSCWDGCQLHSNVANC